MKNNLKLGIFMVILSTIISCSTKQEKKQETSVNKTPEQQVHKILVGTYTNEDSEGIYTLDFNLETGELSNQQLVAKSESPSYLVKNSDGSKVFAVNETDPGMVSSFSWNEEKTQLIQQSNISSEGMHPCFVELNQKEDLLAIANYSSGNIAVYNVEDAAKISGAQVRNHEGSSIVKPNQDVPHAHCSKFSKDGKFLYVADLGTDEIVGYGIDENNRLGEKFTAYKMDAGDGPRHFVYHPTENLAYIVSEFSNTVTAVSIDTETGVFEKIDKKSSLPEDFKEDSFGADIHITSDGKFLYSTNRGHNSIAIFSIAENGSLILIGTESVHGNWPRNFVISPNEKFLLVANQLSDNITVFKRNPETGLLTFTETDFKMSKPVCLKF